MNWSKNKIRTNKKKIIVNRQNLKICPTCKKPCSFTKNSQTSKTRKTLKIRLNFQYSNHGCVGSLMVIITRSGIIELSSSSNLVSWIHFAMPLRKIGIYFFSTSHGLNRRTVLNIWHSNYFELWPLHFLKILLLVFK